MATISWISRNVLCKLWVVWVTFRFSASDPPCFFRVFEAGVGPDTVQKERARGLFGTIGGQEGPMGDYQGLPSLVS